MNVAEFAQLIDYVDVRPDATLDDILCGARESVECGFKCFAVSPTYVRVAKKALGDSGVLVDTTSGYPSGAHPVKVKILEAEYVVSEGADEIDMVMNIGALKSREYSVIEDELTGVANAVKGRTLKVIIETCYLTDEEKRTACKICTSIPGVHFVKTSTGFGPEGATLHDVELIKEEVTDRLGIKAAGGIRTAEDAIRMIRAGATRIGTSQGPAILDGYANLLEEGKGLICAICE